MSVLCDRPVRRTVGYEIEVVAQSFPHQFGGYCTYVDPDPLAAFILRRDAAQCKVGCFASIRLIHSISVSASVQMSLSVAPAAIEPIGAA